MANEKKINLTEQEIDLLKLYLNVYSSNVDGEKTIQKEKDLIWVRNAENVGLCFKYGEGLFESLEENVKYTPNELGVK